MKRIPTAALALCLLLSLTACGEQSSGKIPGGKGDLSEKPNPDVDTVTGEAAQAALDLLRQCMADSPKVAAVAYLGYRDATEQDGDLTDWLWTNVPGLMEEMAFLQSIPTDRVLNGGCGDLYCIVPRDEHTSLAVNHVVWRSTAASTPSLCCWISAASAMSPAWTMRAICGPRPRRWDWRIPSGTAAAGCWS